MKRLFVLLTILLAANCLSDYENWAAFKDEHSKSYKNVVEENYRFKIFQDNLRIIEAHNERYNNGQETYYMGVNKFTDQTSEEFRVKIKQQKPDLPDMDLSNVRLHKKNTKSRVSGIDWREKGVVLDVRDQGDSGILWAFAIIGSVESQNAIINKQKIPLSVQEIIDCSIVNGKGYHNGSELIRGFYYAMDYGIVAETDYPFRGKQLKCSVNKNKNVFQPNELYFASDEEELEDIVTHIGPAASKVNANCFQHYKGGIFSNVSCANTEYDVNFAVLTVGFKTDDNGLDYWILQNSFGTNWGENGYMRIQKGNYDSGIGVYSILTSIKK